MIRSDILKINKIENFDNIYIEEEISKHFSSIIRWAIISIDNEHIEISISYQI